MSKVLITGGTGSLGRTLAEYFLVNTDKTVCILSRDEVKQAQMAHDFRLYSDRMRFFLGDVRDRARLDTALHGVQWVVHAAALKRIDNVCYDPEEVWKTNIQGTSNVLHAAMQMGVEKVLLISSDKACYPTNAYGVSKAMAEWNTVTFNSYGYPRGLMSSVLRYGNVLGSRGSVLKIWSDQIKETGTVNLTHSDMTRYLLTLNQAANLVGNCLEDMHGGEIFVPKLKSHKMVDLAYALGARKTIITGMRPGGEKIHETMLTEEESFHSYDLGSVVAVAPHQRPWSTHDPFYDSKPWKGFGFASHDYTFGHYNVGDLRDIVDQNRGLL